MCIYSRVCYKATRIIHGKLDGLPSASISILIHPSEHPFAHTTELRAIVLNQFECLPWQGIDIVVFVDFRRDFC